MTLLFSRRLFILSLPLAVTAASAQASGGGEKKAAEPAVRLASVGIPVTRDKVVVNYLFLSVRINLNPSASETKLRELEPVFRDTLVRAAHRTSFGKADRDDQLDEARFKSVMMQEFGKIAGPGAIKSIDILSQSPKKNRG